MTREELTEERRADKETLAEVYAWKRESQRELLKMSSQEQLAYLNKFGREYAAKHGVHYLEPTQ